MKSVKYAIVIVTYNRVKLLRESVTQAVNQTIRPASIIVVNNASTDDTGAYLESLTSQDIIDVVNLSQNIGGAGGFAKGIECALEKDVECVLVIDDDALIAKDYMEKILRAREQYPNYRAFAGVVETEGEIDLYHRRNFSKSGLMTRNVRRKQYKEDYFTCNCASFCGMVVDIGLIRQIGLPHPEYFISFDDTEYSLRICRYSKFLVIVSAKLNHKREPEHLRYPRRYSWKDYYAIRNRLLMVKEHGNILDKVINFIDIFIHIIFRNWWFGLIRRDHYDWRYERHLVKAALCDAANRRMRNIGMEQEEQDKYQVEYSGIHKETV